MKIPKGEIPGKKRRTKIFIGMLQKCRCFAIAAYYVHTGFKFIHYFGFRRHRAKILILYYSKDGGNLKKNPFWSILTNFWSSLFCQVFSRNLLNLFGLKLTKHSYIRRYENVVYFNSHLRWKPLTRILRTFCACEWWIPWGFFCKSLDRFPTIWRRMRSRLWPWPLWVCRKWGPVHRNLLPRQ